MFRITANGCTCLTYYSKFTLIFSAEMKENKIKYVMSTVSHEQIYTIFCKVKSEYKLLQFSQDDISNEKSLFFDDNKKSKVYEWFCLIEKEISSLQW